MKKRVLCFSSFLMYILIVCTALSGKIEDTMMTRVEIGPVNTKAVHETVTRELPERALFRDEQGIHLYEVSDGSGWEGGKRIREVSGWTLQADGTVTVPGYPDTAYVYSANRQPKPGEQVLVLERSEKGTDIYLALYPDGIPENVEYPTGVAALSLGNHAIFMEGTDFLLPFLEHRAKTEGEILSGAERIFSWNDVIQFLNQVPGIFRILCTVGMGLLFLGAAWVQRARGNRLFWGNFMVSVGMLFVLRYLLRSVDLPLSMLPKDNLLAISSYQRMLEAFFDGLTSFPEQWEKAVAMRASVMKQCRSLALFSFAFTAMTLLLEKIGMKAAKSKKV